MRARVWQNFVERAAADVRVLDEKDIAQLSKWQMNGRDIKNAFNMAIVWCQQRQIPLTAEAVEDLISLVCPFASKDTSGGDANHRRTGSVKTSATHDMRDNLLEF